MRRLVLSLSCFLSLAAAREAFANSCTAYNRYVVTTEVPLGCPLVAYLHHDVPWQLYAMEIERAGHRMPVTAPPATLVDQIALPVYVEEIDDLCVEWRGIELQPYDHFEIALPSEAQVGDHILI